MAEALKKENWQVTPWIAFAMVEEDWWKGFRQVFPTRVDMAEAITAGQDPATRTWRFSQREGVPFVRGTAVNRFGRMAALTTAGARRLLDLALGPYADDTGGVDAETQAPLAQAWFKQRTGCGG